MNLGVTIWPVKLGVSKAGEMAVSTPPTGPVGSSSGNRPVHETSTILHKPRRERERERECSCKVQLFWVCLIVCFIVFLSR